MLNLIIFVLACYGCTAILTWGKIFDAIRPKYAFFHCCQCVGFWVGAGMFLMFWFSGVKMFPSIYTGTFIFAGLGSGVSYILDSLFGDFGIKVEIKAKKATNYIKQESEI